MLIIYWYLYKIVDFYNIIFVDHSKKKFLKKLDCYYEEKIYKEIDKLDNLAQNMDRSKMKLTRIIFKKY
ncbi:hypothetical protein PVIIG_05732 [Plasmodium vivax India VII]|uniref:Uncharacterized protein n=1 Tax=Plasmodium vivax India VII TaxID=1077284 RepID=A0A0J9S2G3_PLAVI|nr:hypothetical protein PVIIG_05732 [Plasmodium vivax India VII]